MTMGAIAVWCLLGISAQAQQKGDLPVTSSSREALQLFSDARREMRAYHTTAAQINWHKAVELDPNFAWAHLYLAFFPASPGEQISELQKAVASRSYVSPGEQRLLDWLSYVMQGKMIQSIASLNDLLATYPEDMYLNWGLAWWLQGRRACDHAIPIYRHILKMDRGFAPAWRGLGECYLTNQDFDRGLPALKEYLALVPNDPLSEAFYGEALARAARYKDAMNHCRAALAIDGTNYEALFCSAMVYAFNGDQQRARGEYSKVVTNTDLARSSTPFSAAIYSATTYVRERHFEKADQAFQEVADRAHKAERGFWEAEAYRSMALYQEDTSIGLGFLKKAEGALQEHPITGIDRVTKLVSVLQTRVVLALRLKDLKMAEEAVEQIKQLEEASHLPAVEQSYSGGVGLLLAAQGQYEEAASYLEEDPSAYSMKCLITVYQKTGASDAAQKTLRKLTQNRSLSLEEALIISDLHTSSLSRR